MLMRVAVAVVAVIKLKQHEVQIGWTNLLQITILMGLRNRCANVELKKFIEILELDLYDKSLISKAFPSKERIIQPSFK